MLSFVAWSPRTKCTNYHNLYAFERDWPKIFGDQVLLKGDQMFLDLAQVDSSRYLKSATVK